MELYILGEFIPNLELHDRALYAIKLWHYKITQVELCLLNSNRNWLNSSFGEQVGDVFVKTGQRGVWIK